MPVKKVRFYCHYCKKTRTLRLDDDFQEKFISQADKWPYPLLVPHEGHFAVVFLDEDFVERGVTVTRMELDFSS
ncbi:MAG: hypothetical protein ACTSYI_15665 [Promethearchaeota archaeon]